MRPCCDLRYRPNLWRTIERIEKDASKRLWVDVSGARVPIPDAAILVRLLHVLMPLAVKPAFWRLTGPPSANEGDPRRASAAHTFYGAVGGQQG
jgi:hypothetical protein